MKFNPVNFVIGLVVGWFFVSFLQAAAVALFTGSWSNLAGDFSRIAFFKDGKAIAINIVIIVVTGGIGTFIWKQLSNR